MAELNFYDVLYYADRPLDVVKDKPREIICICPECGNKCLSLNKEKGVFHCPACGFGEKGESLMIDLWCYLNDIQKAPLVEKRRQGGIEFNKKAQGGLLAKPEVKKVYKEEGKSRASDEVIDKTYRLMLCELPLDDAHKKSLLARGLDEKTIELNCYRSAPQSSNALCRRLLDKGVALEGVPGFYKEGASWRFINYGSGILIPSRDEKGRIRNMQIRKDEPHDGCKYLTVSSTGKDSGAPGKTSPHFAPGRKEESIFRAGRINKSKLILTEGALKADIIAHFTGLNCIGVLGVNALSELKKMLAGLKPFGFNEILIAYDMDLYEKETVRNAYGKLKQILVDENIIHSSLVWDRRYKGLDDYLLFQL